MASPPVDPLVGTTLDGRYQVVEVLAEGGMATVYLALDERLDREVALKVMRASLAHDPAFVDRFRREAVAAARLSHPNIVTIHDHSEDQGLVFLVLEYVPGVTLREALNAEGSFTARKALNVLTPILEALSFAHSAGIIHRDIKPENVIIRTDGTVKVADFGLARAVSSTTMTSATGEVLGTVAYVAPEQVARNAASVRSDVYSAGILLFEMLTGTKPFAGDTAISVAWQHVNEGVPAASSRVPGIPPALDALIAHATARAPEDRPADAAQFLALVRQVRAGLTPEELNRHPGPGASAPLHQTQALPAWDNAPAPPPPPLRTPVAVQTDPGPPPRRRLLPLLLLLLVLGGGGFGGWWFLVGPGAMTTVPAVVNQSADEAAGTLTRAHLTSSVTEEFSETVAKGTVIATDPLPGLEVRRQSMVTLRVSKGPERYTVPPLVGTTLEAAKAALTKNKLILGKVTEAFDEKVPKGVVLASDPVAGKALKKGTAVALTVSKGRQPIEVPNLTNTNADQAIAALTKLGLVVDSTAPQENSASVPAGNVLRQSPNSGQLYKGDKVTIVVSKGPVMVEVPNVVGQQVDQATALLQGKGFVVKVERIAGGFFGTVRYQNPTGGTAPQGSTVVLSIV